MPEILRVADCHGSDHAGRWVWPRDVLQRWRTTRVAYADPGVTEAEGLVRRSLEELLRESRHRPRLEAMPFT
jgi:hypothetical protein